MHPHYADGFDIPLQFYRQRAGLGQRQVVLGYLIPFHHIRVGIVFAVKLGIGRDAAAQGQAGHNGVFHRLAVDNRQRAGQTQAHRADPAVGRSVLIIRRARAEHLAPGLQLDMDFQSDDGFVVHSRLTSQVCGFLCRPGISGQAWICRISSMMAGFRSSRRNRTSAVLLCNTRPFSQRTTTFWPKPNSRSNSSCDRLHRFGCPRWTPGKAGSAAPGRLSLLGGRPRRPVPG